MDRSAPSDVDPDKTIASTRKAASGSPSIAPPSTNASSSAGPVGAPAADPDKTIASARRPSDVGTTGSSATHPSMTIESSTTIESSATADSRATSRSTSTAASVARSVTALRTHADAAIASAMLEEEGARAHGFSAIVVIVTLFVSAGLPLLGGDPIAKALSLASLLVMCTASAAVWTITRDPKRYTWWVHRAYALLLGVSVTFVEYYLGLFSPVPVILTLAVLFFAQSSDRVGAYVTPILVVFGWAAFAGLIATGVVVDRGLFPVDHVTMSARIFAIMAVSGVLLLTLAMARLSRASLHDALKRSHESLMIAHERAVQLEEARENLDRALRAVVGKEGRYTGALAGKYRLDLILGVGAMGEVYAAEGDTTSGPVAVKLLQAEASERTDLVERFLREGDICRQLKSPHVVRVLDVGRMEDGAPYLAMERLRGEDLASRLQREGHLSLADAALLVREVAKGLDHAHDAGVVHRDLKPQNLFHASCDDGVARWKILDFGVSKLGGSSGTLTETQMIGTPGYMSPEQARGLPVDRRSDLFSLAVVAYRALTGRPPFSGPSVPETLFEIVYRAPEAPTKWRSDVPHDVELVLAIALSKEPEHRFQTATELAKAFAAACRRDASSELRERGVASIRRHPWGT